MSVQTESTLPSGQAQVRHSRDSKSHLSLSRPLLVFPLPHFSLSLIDVPSASRPVRHQWEWKVSNVGGKAAPNMAPKTSDYPRHPPAPSSIPSLRRRHWTDPILSRSSTELEEAFKVQP